MDTPSIEKNPTKVRPTTAGRGKWLGLGLLVLVAAFSVYAASRSVPAAAPISAPIVAQSVADASSQGVLNYVQAHAVAQGEAVRPETQSVLDYLRVHAVAQGEAVRPETQSVLDYLRVHAVVSGPMTITPNMQSVMDYLRVHSK